MMRLKNTFIFGFLAIITLSLLTSCFPEDQHEPLIPFKGIIGSTYNSIYTHQSYYSLSDSSELSYNLNSAWDLGFEASTNGEHVILNNSDLLRVANLGTVDFTGTTSVPVNAKWLYDSSTGNFDSLSVMNWVNTNVTPYEYSKNVYVLGQYGENKIIPFKKFQLIEVTNELYKVVIDNLDNSNLDTLTVLKNSNLNFVKTTIRQKAQIVTIEPNSNKWDIQFTQYEDSIPDDTEILYSYLLRGAFINPAKIKVAQYYITTDEVPENLVDPNRESDELKIYFESNSIKPKDDSFYSSNWDDIGWEWKDVTIDKEANTAYYKADTRRIFLIKDIINGKSYKLRFFSYYSNGVVGYPWFQYIEM